MTTLLAVLLLSVPPTDCMPGVEDYTQIWWAHGLRHRSADDRMIRCVRTGRWGVALDVENVELRRLGAIDDLVSYDEALTQSNEPVFGLPRAELDIHVDVGGKRYACVRSEVAERGFGSARLVESGRFFQRTDLLGLEFEDAEGARLNATGRLELAAWPDRLSLLVDVEPTHAPIPPGPAFGRVGNGFRFDRGNHLDVPYRDEFDPEQLTLEAWVFCLKDITREQGHSWLVCKGHHELADGGYGLMLQAGRVAAVMNFGGGRENMVMVLGDLSPARHGNPDALPLEQWSHLAMTYDGRRLLLYVDGREVGSAEVNRRRTVARGDLTIGRRQDGSGDGYPLRGLLDEVRIHDRALSPDEIKAYVADPTAAGSTDSVVARWDFDEPGQPRLSRPGDPWKNARLEVSVRQAGRTIESNTPRETDDVWALGESRRAWVDLTPLVSEASPGGSLRSTPATQPQHAENDGLKVVAVDMSNEAECPTEYDPIRGWHRIDLGRVVAQGTSPDVLERVKIRLDNPTDGPRTFRLLLAKDGRGLSIPRMSPITGMSPMLRDENGQPTGIPVQISKNWHSRRDEYTLYQGLWFHGLTMLDVPARSQTEVEFTLAYAHWGGVPAASHAQLCLIGWGSNQLWQQSAVGSWGESICYEPDQGQRGGTVLDTRPLMVWSMNRDEPVKWSWTNNVGGADFLVYYDATGKKQWNSRMRTAYRRYGPNLTEAAYGGRSADGKIDVAMTVSLCRSDDVVRGVYRFRYDVRQAVDFSRLVFFQCGGDDYSYTGERRFALGAENGLTEEWDTQWGGGVYRHGPLPMEGRIPWVAMSQAVSRDPSESGAWANRGIILRHWDARLGGHPASPYMAERGAKVRGSDTSTVDILPPPGVKRLLPGDYVEAQVVHVVMPQKASDYYGPNENLRAALLRDADTWRMIQREAVGNDLGVRVDRGRLVRSYPVEIETDAGDRAEFHVTGGLGYVPIKLSGLRAHDSYQLTRLIDGAEERVDQSVFGDDFWQSDYDAGSRTWSRTYNVSLDSPSDQRRTVRFLFGPRDGS